MHVLGIDIGGSGIKGAPVDVTTGELVAPRHRIPTPAPSVPEAVADIVGELADYFDWDGLVGCTFPGVVMHGLIRTAANMDDAWIDCDGTTLFTDAVGSPVTLLNDADAAGLAEARFGAAQDEPGVVLLLTLGTGIGSALLHDGVLTPNTELGHLDMGGRSAEDRASSRVKDDEGLSWKEWARRFEAYLHELERLLWPDVFVIGGGISKKFDRYGPLLELRTPIVPATLGNHAGLVGAAMAAAD